MFHYYYSFYIIFFISKYSLTLNNNEQCLIHDACTNSSIRSPSIYKNERFIQSRNCFCDSVCEQYGDCCYPMNNLLTNNYECVDYLLPTISTKSLPFNGLFVWMRTKCLSLYVGSKIDRQCRNLNNESFHHNPIVFIPVTSLQTNITYRNYYCAYCNNDINENIVFWEYKTFCHGNGSNSDYLVLNDDQQLNYYVYNLTRNCLKTILYPHEHGKSEPSVFIRPCKKSSISTCPVGTSIDLVRNCSSSSTAYRYVRNSTIIYRNSYCAKCNHINNSDDELTCLDPNLRSSLPPMTHIRIHPLSILFDPNLLKYYLNNNTIPNIIYSINYTCMNSDELYDLFEGKCSKITNSDQEFITSMKCSHPIRTSIKSNEDIYNNGSIHLVDSDYSILLTKDNYIFVSNNQIIFCNDHWQNSSSSFDKISSFPFYRNILSIIFTSISLGCLILFIFIFCLIPSLHNLPGKFLLFLSISLLIGQLTFISTSHLTNSTSICFISAIVVHYFYLSSFFWLLLISFHIHSTFNYRLIQQDKENKTSHRIIIYNILVWCSSATIILIACLIQFINPESRFSPAYGTLFCSISRPYSLIIFFLLPIGCIFSIVSILFIKTILSIYRSHNVAKLVKDVTLPSSSSTNNNLVLIYARLTSLMGIQWILLIVALIIQQTWSWIIFEIINSLPGLFICFGFLCSRRILNNLKQNFTIKLIHRQQSSQSNQTTSTILMSPSLPKITAKQKFHF